MSRYPRGRAETMSSTPAITRLYKICKHKAGRMTRSQKACMLTLVPNRLRSLESHRLSRRETKEITSDFLRCAPCISSDVVPFLLLEFSSIRSESGKGRNCCKNLNEISQIPTGNGMIARSFHAFWNVRCSF